MTTDLTFEERLTELAERLIALPLAAKFAVGGGLLALIVAIVAVVVEYPAAPSRPSFPSISGSIPAYVSSSQIFPTSFDCSQTTDWADKMVCHEPNLSRADRQIAALYAERRDNLDGVAQAAFQARQSQWLAARDQCITADDPVWCLRLIHNARISALQVQ